jgi:hypothetical protein
MRRLLAVQSHLAVRLVIFLMVSTGLAALIAGVFLIRPPSDWIEWIRPIRQTALGIGGSFLAAAAIALRLLPPRRDVVRSASSSPDAVPASGILLLIAGLAIASLWQVPTLFAWWDESSRLIDQLTAGERDPSGLWIIPAALASAPPFIAALIIALFVEAAIGLAAARPPVATRLFRTGVLLLCGLVAGSSFALPPIQDLLARVTALAASGPDATVAATITGAVAPQTAFASALLYRFQWILGGYVLAALALPSRQPPRELEGGALPVTTAPVIESPTLAAEFNAPEYRVRLRTHWLMAAFRIGDLDYAITPRQAGAGDQGFSFSEQDGLLRRQSDGRSVLTVRPDGNRWSLKTSYAVGDPSGGVIGILERDGGDWHVLDRFRRPLAEVQEDETRKGYFRYSMRAGGVEVCRFTWAMQGLGVWSAEMDVEFCDAPTGRLDPAYAMALAPILEARARRTSQWMN